KFSDEFIPGLEAVPMRCTATMRDGNCTLARCDVPLAPPSVGELQGTTGATSFSLGPDANRGWFDGMIGQYDMWPAAGTRITINGTGGSDVPAFVGTIVMPPSTDLTGFGPITRNSDAVLQWSPVSADVMIVATGMDASRVIACQFDGTSGSGT